MCSCTDTNGGSWVAPGKGVFGWGQIRRCRRKWSCRLNFLRRQTGHS